MKKIALFFLFLLPSFFTFATDTNIIVRAKAKDAKFIGSSIGGAYVIIRNKANHQILAEGMTSGSTGNTNLIMKTPKERGMSIADEKTAQFLATIDIAEPTFIRIEVMAPYTSKQAQVQASTELWLIPGKDIVGDGVILEIPGFIVDILSPRRHQYLSLASVSTTPIQVQANIVMMCGCTISKGGLWNSEEMEVKGILKKDGKLFKDIDLSLTEKNLFTGKITVDTAGKYELIIYAYHPKTGNTGVDKINYVIYE